MYRWRDSEDQAYVSRWAAEEWSTSEAEAGSADEIEDFRRRQISRMAILGATAENKPLLDQSYRRILAAFEPHVGMNSYLFGTRPSLADFAWFGQLSQMATDPTPMRIMRERAPFTDHWVRRLDDASGVEGAWYPREQALAGTAEALLGIAGELYLPFLVANAEAFAKGLDRLEINVWGLPYALAPFKYQIKCLQQLRDKFSALDAESRRAAADSRAHRLLGASDRATTAFSGCAIVDWRLPGGRPDFVLLSQHTSQAPCRQQCPFNVLVAGALFKKDHHFAIGALPGIAGLQSLRPVPKSGFASGAMDLN
jgi:hypothetical protein